MDVPTVAGPTSLIRLWRSLCRAVAWCRYSNAVVGGTRRSNTRASTTSSTLPFRPGTSRSTGPTRDGSTSRGRLLQPARPVTPPKRRSRSRLGRGVTSTHRRRRRFGQRGHSSTKLLRLVVRSSASRKTVPANTPRWSRQLTGTRWHRTASASCWSREDRGISA